MTDEYDMGKLRKMQFSYRKPIRNFITLTKFAFRYFYFYFKPLYIILNFFTIRMPVSSFQQKLRWFEMSSGTKLSSIGEIIIQTVR